MRNPYEVLGVPRGATPDEIKAAFRRLASQHHPDRNPGDDGAQHRFKELNAAYQILSDPQKRAVYDRFGVEGGAAGGPFGAGVPFDFSEFAANLPPLDGFLGDLLEKFGWKQGERGDLRKELTLRLEEAAFGAEKELTYERVTVCVTCSGGGARPGSVSPPCGACGGRGKVRVQQGFLPLAMERDCASCQGRGRVVSDPCTVCRGTGLVSQSRTVVVTVPPGVEDGATRLVERGGSMTRPDRPSGDLELVLRIGPHPFFQRVGDDLRCAAPVSFAKACLGGELDVPTLEGRGRVRVPAGTQPGTVLRIKGKGMTRRLGGGRGDQLVEIKVEVPVRLSARGQELMQQLAEELGETVQPQQKTFMEKLKELFG